MSGMQHRLVAFLVLAACGTPVAPVAGGSAPVSPARVAAAPTSDAGAPPSDAGPDAPDAPPVDYSRFSYVMGEPIGTIKTGMTPAQVEAALGRPKDRTQPAEGQAIPGYESQWTYATGESISFLGPKPSQLTVFRIVLHAPSKLATKRGIAIGSTRAAVEKAYAAELQGLPSGSGDDGIIVGDVYAGALSFGIGANGRVEEICACVAF